MQVFPKVTVFSTKSHFDIKRINLKVNMRLGGEENSLRKNPHWEMTPVLSNHSCSILRQLDGLIDCSSFRLLPLNGVLDDGGVDDTLEFKH